MRAGPGVTRGARHVEVSPAPWLRGHGAGPQVLGSPRTRNPSPGSHDLPGALGESLSLLRPQGPVVVSRCLECSADKPQKWNTHRGCLPGTEKENWGSICHFLSTHPFFQEAFLGHSLAARGCPQAPTAAHTPHLRHVSVSPAAPHGSHQTSAERTRFPGGRGGDSVATLGCRARHQTPPHLVPPRPCCLPVGLGAAVRPSWEESPRSLSPPVTQLEGRAHFNG